MPSNAMIWRSITTLLLTWTSALCALNESFTVLGGQDVRLSLNGIEYSNNSVMDIHAIGANSKDPSTEALQCITDLRPCCRIPFNTPSLMGEWYYPGPNRTRVHGAEIVGLPFFRTRGENNGTVNLFRLNTDIAEPVGRFCCEIPNTNRVNQTLCVGIVPPTFIQVTASGSSTVGQAYTLSCSVPGQTVTTYQWKKHASLLSSEMGPTLLIAALRINSGGRYTCEATVDGIVYSKDINVTVRSPPPVNVQATQSSASAPVEVSWSPPSSGPTNITAYRIFYSNGVSTIVDSVITAVSLKLSGNYINQQVYVQSEIKSASLISSIASEAVSATVVLSVLQNSETNQPSVPSSLCTCDVAISLGIAILIVVIIIIIIVTVVMVIHRQRKRSSGEHASVGTELGDLLPPRSTDGGLQVYEDPDSFVRKNISLGNIQLTECPAYATTGRHSQGRTEQKQTGSPGYSLGTYTNIDEMHT